MNTVSAGALAERLSQHFPKLEIVLGFNDPVGSEIVANVTPLGMSEGDPLPLDVDRLQPSTMVSEVVMKQEQTPFLVAALARGCQVQAGTDMLFEQIPAYRDFSDLPVATLDELRRFAQICC